MYDIKRKMRLHIYGAYNESAENAYRAGYLEALQDVRTVMGGNFPVDPSLHKEKADTLDKLELAIMQKLYSQVADIGWYMKQREGKSILETKEAND